MEQGQAPIREIVRSEYFSTANEPAITIRQPMVKFSASCLCRFPNTDYIHFVMESQKKRLIIEPASPDMLHAIRWSSIGNEKRRPKTIICKEYYLRLRRLMGWSDECRYKIIGKVSDDGNGKNIIIFELNSALTYRPGADDKVMREPEYPKSWGDGFGVTAEEIESDPLITRFSEDTAIQNTDEPGEAEDTFDFDTEHSHEQQL